MNSPHTKEWPTITHHADPDVTLVRMTKDDFNRGLACVNALAGMNPEAVAEAVEALREARDAMAMASVGSYGRLQWATHRAKNALAKLKSP